MINDIKGEILSNINLLNIAKKLKLNLKVICIDELKNYNNHKMFIINLSKLSEKGTHWVALLILNSTVYYYDSFGIKAPNEINQYCKINKFRLLYNKYIHQDISDNSCGWYCLFFLINMIYYDFDFNKVIKLLKNNDINNNNKIELFFDKLFKIKIHSP